MPIRKIVDATWGKLSGTWKLVITVGGGLLLILLLWQYVTSAVNWASRKIFNGKNAIITAQIQKDLDDAQKAKAIATDAIVELAIKKNELAHKEEAYAEEKHKRELAEAVLADKSKNTDQKLRAYEEALKRSPTVHIEPESNAEQCARAAALGIDLAICR